MVAVIYARFSSTRQTEQSIEGQIAVCQAYARQHGITVIGEYVDRAKSASKDVEKRDYFQKMIKDSSKGKFDTVLVYSLDRFARDRYDSAIYKRKLKKNAAKVISATENIKDDPSDVLMEAVLEGMAEYYSRELSQKINRGLTINAEKCLVNGTIPLGYKAVDKKYVINEDEALLVRKIFEVYLNGESMNNICNYLNGLGYRTKTGAIFKITSINKILQNKRYAGYYIYRGQEVKGGIPAIISEDVFTEVAERMAKNKKVSSASKAIGEQYLLTSRLFCGHCGEMMRGTSGYGKLGKLYQYYECGGAQKRPKVCNKKNINKDKIEQIVVKMCLDQLTDDNINKIVDEVMNICESERDTATYNMLAKKLLKLEKEKQNLVKSLKTGSENESFHSMVLQEFKEIELQEIEVKKLMIHEETIQNTLTREHILFFLTDLRRGDIKDFKYRQLLVDVFINKIYLYDDKIKVIFTTQHDKTEMDLEILADLEGSDLPPSTKRK